LSFTRASERRSKTSTPAIPYKGDAYYVKALVARLRWEGCEDREEVVQQFRENWPEAAGEAKRLYDEALKMKKMLEVE